MRVMWFVNIPMPAMDARMGQSTRGSGWWMSSLLDKLRDRNDVEIAVVTASLGMSKVQFREAGVDYFVVPQERNDSEDVLLRKCASIVSEWKPDLIHVHGTERFFGLLKARHLTEVPLVVSVQGLLGPYGKHYYGGMDFWEIVKAHQAKDLVRGFGLWGQRRELLRGAVREAEIIRSADAILGRTDWDKAETWAIEPYGRYFVVNELMRPGFWESPAWSVQGCQRNVLMATNLRMPLKGVDTLLEALSILRQVIPDVRLKVAAGISERSGYGRHLMRKMARLNLGDSVDLMGYLDEPKLVEELQSSHCFVAPSVIDNSPNSLCEAMLMGLPIVTTYVGGIPSLIGHERSGLLAPARDPALLAYHMFRILTDDVLATALGQRGRQEARQRHAPEKVVEELLTAYDRIAHA